MDTSSSKSPYKHKTTAERYTLGILLGLFLVAISSAQPADEHASHHPGAGSTEVTPAPVGSIEPSAAAGDMMGEMMKGMGVPPPKELYPTLMTLPELTPEHRQVVERQSGERMHAGAKLIGRALDTLNAVTQAGDNAAMQEAIARLREGTAQLESGIAARRALAEGRLPREVALTWFKREMSLSPASTSAPRQVFGVAPFHLFTMVLLVVFALVMVALYFFKMRRAAALFGRIETDKKSPPPGSALELAGGKPAATP